MKWILLAAIMICSGPIFAKNILVTIAPLHSLVENVSGGVNKVDLLINSNVSPHHYQLKPSDVKKIKNAEIIFMVGEGFEMFLQKGFEQSNKVSLVNTNELKLLPVRSDCDCHTAGPLHSHTDLHFWGSPENAKTIAFKVAEVLGSHDPDNKGIYLANAIKTAEKISALDAKIRHILAPFKNEPFLVFHDGYQYFERHYQLHNVGTVTAGHDNVHGAKTLGRLIKIIEKTKAKCIFAEPQFSPHIVQKIAEQTKINIGYLDIEGIVTDADPAQRYFLMMEQNANNFAKCFS